MSATVSIAAVGLRGAGVRYGRPPAPPQHRQLSRRARSIGLKTSQQAWAEYDAQRGGEGGVRLNDPEMCWSGGQHWVCCLCDREFVSPSGARKHMHAEGHPVLRWLALYEEEASTWKEEMD